MHLERLRSVLEVVSVAGRPVSAVEVQKVTGLPKPTCYQLTQTLQDQGLIATPMGDGRVVVGERLIRVAHLGKSDVDARRAAAPLLKTTAVQLNEPVFLARLRNLQVEIIHVETPDDTARAYIHPGLGVRPMHTCSCSKAIARGFAASDQEIDLGIASVAAPVSIGNAGTTFSVGAVGPIRRFGEAARLEIGAKLIKLAGCVSGAIQLCGVAEV